MKAKWISELSKSGRNTLFDAVAETLADGIRIPSVLGAALLLISVGCGPSETTDPSAQDGGGADTGGAETGPADGGDVDCPISADGTCQCQYEGKSTGVCEGGSFDPQSGECQEPEDYEATESSCGDGRDNDCDGDVDCADGDCTGSACGVGQGTAECVGDVCREVVCHDGVDNDEDGTTDCLDPDCEGATCDAERPASECPAPEDWEETESSCDGLDNNCDGETDEGVEQMCSTQTGVCGGSTSSCTGGSFPDCGSDEFGADYEDPETTKCDGLDNDCDGATDEWDAVGCTAFRLMGTAEADLVRATAGDDSGHVYVVGETGAELGSGTYNGGASDGFVAKFDSAGARQWVRLIGTSKLDTVADVAVDHSGAIYVAGKTEGGIGNNSNAGMTDGFVAKYDGSGARKWVNQIGTSSVDAATGVGTGGSGDAWVTGRTRGAVPSSCLGSCHKGKSDVFVARFEAGGSKAWDRQIGTPEDDIATGIAVNSAPHGYVVGRTDGDLNGSGSGGGQFDAFVVKFRANGSGGDSADTAILDSTSFDSALDVETAPGTGGGANPPPQIYVVGETEGDLESRPNNGGRDGFAARFDGIGSLQWTRLLGSSVGDDLSAVVFSGGKLRVGGSTKGDLAGETHVGGRDGLWAEYDPSGSRQNVQLLATAEDERVLGMTVDDAGRFFAAGWTAGELGGWPNAGMRDGFVALLQ